MPLTTQDFVAQAKSIIQECDVNSAVQKIAAGALALDVREPQEYMQGHIPGAVELPRGVIEFRAPEHPALTDKNQEILVYCQAGGRGALATATLQQMGFTKVSNLLGGYGAWVTENQPEEKAPEEWR